MHPSAVVDPGARSAPTSPSARWRSSRPARDRRRRARSARTRIVGAGARSARHAAAPRVTLGARLLDRRALHPPPRRGHRRRRLRLRARSTARWEKIEQLGAVRIGDDVEIGANTCIDRGALDDTVIDDGVKLDNLIQIGHNVRIGAHTAIAGCVGIAGSATIGAHCTIGGGAGIVGPPDDRRPRAHHRRRRSSRARSPSRASTAALSRSTTMRPGKRTPPRCGNCTRCASGCGRWRRSQHHDRRWTSTRSSRSCRTAIPFLLVDRVLELEHGKRIKALKNVTINEPFFIGHFPHRPVMPGVLMLEALAQAAALLSFDAVASTPDDKTVVLLRRHRRRALQAPGRAGRPADPRRRRSTA